MKRKTKYISFIILLVLIFFYLIGSNAINNNKYNNVLILKSYIPIPVKTFLKDTIFFIPSLKEQIKALEDKNLQLKLSLNYYKKYSEKLETQQKSNKKISFKINMSDQVINTKFNSYILKKFNTIDLTNGKANDAIASGYLEILGDKILIVSGDGLVFYFNIDDLDNSKFSTVKIENNLREIIKFEEFFIKSKYGVKDIFVDKTKLYLSYSNILSNGCVNIKILVAEINTEFLNFKNFFNPDDCVFENNDYDSFNAHIAGGRITDFKDNKILFSTAAFGNSPLAQSDSGIFGKILSIDKNSGRWEIISKGHRNVQGLKYDRNLDRIFSTEHGPTGGDEFNINNNPKTNDIKNFGWPIASYGEHSGQGVKKENKYKKAPLHKSHKKYSFIEPIKYFTPSIGISELIKIPKKFGYEFNNDFFVSSMGNNREEGDLSIHHLKLNKTGTEIIKEDVIFIGERIRDLLYLEKHNAILLFLENSPALGVLKLDKKE